MRSDALASLQVAQGELPLAIDGLAPATIVAPERPQEVADILADAEMHGMAVAPVGGGTSLALGNIPTRVDIGLSMQRIAGVIAYEPTDLTLSVWAGSTFADVQAVLAEHGQALPIDVPLPDEATIGGLVATAIAGPRRAGAATFRDLLIGISAAHPSGTVTKAGGMVVKNVTGFDLMRLYLGSLGTLGVIVSVNLKILPMARHEVTRSASFDNAGAAMDAAERVRASRVRPVALEVFQDGSTWRVAARIEGRESTTQLLSDEAAELLHGESVVVEGRASAAWWQRYTDAQAVVAGEDDALIRCGVPPKATKALLKALLGALNQADIETPLLAVTPATGQATVGVRLAGVAGDERFLRLHQHLMQIADNVVVLAAPAAWKRNLDVWGREPETIDVMRALKQEFDPASVLNPGRFAGRI